MKKTEIFNFLPIPKGDILQELSMFGSAYFEILFIF